jgi:hypothetical protein
LSSAFVKPPFRAANVDEVLLDDIVGKKKTAAKRVVEGQKVCYKARSSRPPHPVKVSLSVNSRSKRACGTLDTPAMETPRIAGLLATKHAMLAFEAAPRPPQICRRGSASRSRRSRPFASDATRGSFHAPPIKDQIR